jgi:hypothetical protein
VQLARRQALFQAGEPLTTVYFPDTAVVSLGSRLGSGEALDVGFVGSEGVAGTAVLPGITAMPCDGIVQVAGRARRLSAARLRTEVQAHASLHSAMDCFSHLLLVRGMQVSLCNMFHTADRRCIRSLLPKSRPTPP